ncbi:MAG TPA: FAD-dependent monooxygenase [Actinomycetota bacterium]|nr:FAD-dependent monooxygenase [Actinomycetota bacterium]
MARPSVQRADLVIIGGGIAGGALATVMARSGARVVVLERETHYRDHIRGEILWQWGFADARRLGLEEVLLEAGGLIVPRFVLYDEAAEPVRDDLAAEIPGIPGSLNLAHPVACRALIDAAAAAGADVRRGVRDARANPGARPEVSWTEGGRAASATADLVIGADGRRSAVRQQLGVELRIDPPGNCMAGLYVEGLEGIDDQVNVMARERDLLFYAFPQRDGRARLYLTFPVDQHGRLTGEGDAAHRFLEAASPACLPDGERWTAGTVAGPCATYRCSDSRAELPRDDGVVLIGDAAGYENPLQGLGLSFAMRDVRDLSELLLSRHGWKDVPADFGEQRSHLRGLSKLATELDLWINQGYAQQDPAERAARYETALADDVLRTLVSAASLGFDRLPPDLGPREMWERLGVA